MECNKEEAIRAKEIAEKKFTERDIAGAKKFVLKAQNLYPELEGLSQMLTTLDVYLSLLNKIGDEVDWYGVLGVNPLADDETVKKQYRKLAIMIHPDKNKSVGADGAFKIVSEAWSLLSDKAKRSAYDRKMNLKGFQQRVATKCGGSSAPPNASGFHNFTNSASSNETAQNNTARVGPTSVPSPSYQKTDTFWTICNRCKMHYEYLRIYFNQTLLCPNCHEGFMALETAPPSNVSKSSNWSSRQRHRNSNHHVTNNNPFNPGRNAAVAQNLGPGRSAGVNSFNHISFQSGSFSRPAGFGSSVASVSTSARAASVVQRVNERLKRERGEAEAAAVWEKRSDVSGSILRGERPLKKRRGIYEDRMGNGVAGMGSRSILRKGSFETERVYGVSGANNKPNSVRELSQLEIRSMLMKKAWMEIRKKINEWSSVAAAKSADREKGKVKERGKEKQKGVVNGDGRDLNEYGDSVHIKTGYPVKKFFPGTSADDTDKEALEPMAMNVPDPDFHDFDMDRTESSFGDNQVWAAYDDDDGMPRYYAIIHKVISLNPFKMRISWLNSKTNSELGPLDWIGSGFSKTCGDFRIGKHGISETLNSFSHKVKWTKGTRGAICIFPRKGDAWALYRNWSPDWNEHTPDEVIHKYDMVEVLDDYNGEQGVSVTPLMKVAGFRTVFHHHLDPKEVRKIPKEEMFRFSHQVPYYLLTGQEAQNAPKGCRELDPAATPLELLQVITKANEELMVENGGKVERILQNAQKIKEGEMVENATKAKEEEMGHKIKEEEIMGHTKEVKKAEVEDNAEKAKGVECGNC